MTIEPFPDNSMAWITVPASPPVRVIVLHRLSAVCPECRLPAYRCCSEIGTQMTLCTAMLRKPN